MRPDNDSRKQLLNMPERSEWQDGLRNNLQAEACKGLEWTCTRDIISDIMIICLIQLTG